MKRLRTTLSSQNLRLRRDESGVTLTELIVTMALMTMMLGMVMTIFITFTQSFADERSATSNTAGATVAMNELTRVIRAGTPNPVAPTSPTAVKPPNAPVFSIAGAERIVLQAYLDTDAANPEPVQVEFSITSDRTLVERRWKASLSSEGYFTFPGAAVSQRTVVRQIATGTTPVFRYFNANNNELYPQSNGTLSADDRGLVAAVKVSMTVQTDPSGKAKTASLENTVGIPNLDLSRIGIDR